MTREQERCCGNAVDVAMHPIIASSAKLLICNNFLPGDAFLPYYRTNQKTRNQIIYLIGNSRCCVDDEGNLNDTLSLITVAYFTY